MPDRESNPVLAAALQDAALGMRVFPVVRGKKTPALKNWPKLATTDETTIREWWSGEHRDCGIGIATGDGLWVLDIDPGKGGEDSLGELEREFGKLPDTVECLTGGGGRHLYFKSANGQQIRNATALAGYAGLDVRGEGGFVVAPPSVHESGQKYEWELSSELGEVELATGPAWLLELLEQHGGNGKGRAEPNHPFKTRRRIPIGKRNPTLFSLAGVLRREGFDPEEIEPLLQQVRLRRCEGIDDPQNRFPEEEVHGIAHGIARYEPEHTIAPVAPQDWLQNACSKSLAEIMAGEKPARKPSILGDGLLPERSVGSLFGPPGLGKTQTVITLAMRVAGGRDFFGWKTTPCNILYLCPELDLPEFWDRALAIEAAECAARGHDLGPESARALIEQSRSRIFPVTGDMLPRLPDLKNPEDREAIIAAVRARHAGLLILDPLALLHTASENSNDEMLEVMRGLHEIKVRAETTPLLVHHTRKSLPGMKDPGFDAMRGAGAVAAHVRVILRLEEKRQKLCLSCEKSTHTRRPEPIWLERLDTGALVATDAAGDPSAERDQRAEAVISYVESQDGGPVTIEEIKEHVSAVAELEGRTIRKYLQEESERTDCEPRISAAGATRDRTWRAR
jgi:hypothetical protein